MALITVVSGVIRTDMPPLAQATEQETGLPWWGWLLIVIILAWLLIRWLSRRTTPTNERPAASSSPTRSSGLEPAAGPRAPAAVEAPTAPIAEPTPVGVTETPPIEPLSAVVETPTVPIAEPVLGGVTETPLEPLSAVVEAPPAPAVEPAPGGVVEVPLESVSAVVEAPRTPAVEPAPSGVVESLPGPVSTEEPEPIPVRPDDLTIVEGIGPRIAALLIASGIHTFAQLAATDTDRLRQILHEVGYRVNDPTTWPEQARLAAAGEWDGLKALQDQLKGGRRV